VSRAETALREGVAAHFPPGHARQIGIAVSGGGDSLALLHILAEIAADTPLTLRAVTVDHGLRADAAEEAAMVASIAAGLGITHETVTWTGWGGAGNLQDQARRARYDLLSSWARQHDIEQVAIGHTADDQAETFFMRLARASGVDGLSGMPVRRQHGGVTFVRPLLDQTRASLRNYLTHKGVAWIDDPSNDDTRFDRVKVRQALEHLRPLGLTPQVICETAKNLAAARAALGWYACNEARHLVHIDEGDVVFARASFGQLQPEIARRLLQQALVWVAGTEYPPRRRAIALALAAIRDGTGMTLNGCKIALTSKKIRVFREYSAVRSVVTSSDQPWDGRWQMTGPHANDLRIRALGEEGLAQCNRWRETGLPFSSLAGYPSVWRGDTLVCAPHADFGEGWTATLLRDGDVFFSALLVH
tara:strand:+ start:78691 stop:79944 length:1254 start_codon:yes stop_codon:yes gene_type:complete